MNRELIRRLTPILISAVGIIFFKWEVATFLLFFYTDSLFLIIFAFLKSGLAVQSDYIWKAIPFDAHAYPQKTLRYGATGLFGLFLAVSFGITWFTVGFSAANGIAVTLALLVAVANHVYDFIVFRHTEQYKKVTAAFCIFAPYKRASVFFSAAIVSVNAGYQFAVHALLFFQIAFEVHFWRLEKAERLKEVAPKN